MTSKKCIAFWDFDGTLTRKDSLWAFLIYTQPWSKLFIGAMRFLPVLIGLKLGIVSNVEAKIKVLGFFFGGWEAKKFKMLCEGFAQEVIPAMIHPVAMQKLEWHRLQNHHLVLVSASLEDYLKPWCDAQGMHCIATKMKVVNDEIVAEYEHSNCYGPEKARRINEAYDLASFDKVYAYGNSRGDLEMLDLADEPGYRVF